MHSYLLITWFQYAMILADVFLESLNIQFQHSSSSTRPLYSTSCAELMSSRAFCHHVRHLEVKTFRFTFRCNFSIAGEFFWNTLNQEHRKYIAWRKNYTDKKSRTSYAPFSSSNFDLIFHLCATFIEHGFFRVLFFWSTFSVCLITNKTERYFFSVVIRIALLPVIRIFW